MEPKTSRQIRTTFDVDEFKMKLSTNFCLNGENRSKIIRERLELPGKKTVTIFERWFVYSEDHSKINCLWQLSTDTWKIVLKQMLSVAWTCKFAYFLERFGYLSFFALHHHACSLMVCPIITILFFAVFHTAFWFYRLLLIEYIKYW